MKKYDDASWHYDGEFPEDSPEEYSGTHIGLFLKWCFLQGWAGEMYDEEDVRKVTDGRLSGTDFLFHYCDGKLTSEDFNPEGNAFAEQYYGQDGLYFEDLKREFGELEYVAPEEDHDFEKFSAMLEGRRKSGILTQAQAEAAGG